MAVIFCQTPSDWSARLHDALITIQVMGAIYKIKLKVAKEQAAVYGDTEVIDLWEV